MSHRYTLDGFRDLIAREGGLITLFVEVGVDVGWSPVELAEEITAVNALIEQLGPHLERIAEKVGLVDED